MGTSESQAHIERRREAVVKSFAGKTRKRIAALDSYFHNFVLTEDREFVCEHLDDCRKSHLKAHRDGRFFRGQLHHVGDHYDIAIGGNAVRVVVVGQENGGAPEHITMHQRSCQVVERSGYDRRFKGDSGHKSRNPHMRGTTSLLRLIFGRRPDTDYEGELLTAGGETIHIFNSFALVNYLLCSAVERDSVHTQSTRAMHTHCANHFRRAIEILDPTLIVVQGRNIRRWMGQNGVFELPSEPPGTVVAPIVEFPRINGQKSVPLVAFSHPSYPGPKYGWAGIASPYLLTTVVPTIEHLRSDGLI